MLKLNLVSEELKKEIKLRRVYGIIKRMSGFFILLLIAYTLVLLFARLLILNKFDEIVYQTTLISKNTQGYNDRVKEINSQVDFISAAQAEFIRPSCLLRNLDAFAGAGVKIDQLRLSRDKKAFLIRGKSSERGALLSFKEKLEQSGLFLSVDLPLKNLLTKEDILFEINAGVDITKL